MQVAGQRRGMRGRRIGTMLAGALLLPLLACTDLADARSGAVDPAPKMLWDHRPEATEWTAETLKAVASEDGGLAGIVPSDIATWCPAYPEASVENRRAFWVGLMSALAKHESTWNPRAAGGGGAYVGLLQISPATAQNYGCTATSSAALKDGTENLACAVEIAAVQVGRDRAVAGNGRSGMGRDWGPFRSGQKRAEMAAWTSVQDYCRG